MNKNLFAGVERKERLTRRGAIIVIIGGLLALLALALLPGCGVMESVKGKTVNMEVGIYGMEVQASDVTANGSPSGKLGFGSIDYHSAPMTPGQPFYARRTTSSMWHATPASETEIWIGRASDTCRLEFEAVPGTMIKISGDGIETGETSVSLVSNKTACVPKNAKNETQR